MGSPAPQGSGKLSQYLAACRKIFARLLRAALVAFASVLLAFFFYFFRLLLLRFVRFALSWSLGLVPWPLLHGLLDVVLEALLQIAADCFLNRFLCFAAYHLRHGQSADSFDGCSSFPRSLEGESGGVCIFLTGRGKICPGLHACPLPFDNGSLYGIRLWGSNNPYRASCALKVNHLPRYSLALIL